MAQEIRGDLENTRCPEIIKIISLGKRTGRLALHNGAEKASLFFQEGEIIHAKFGPLEGLKAIYEVALWSSGEYAFIVDDMPEYPSVAKPIDEILDEISERTRQLDRLSSTIGSTGVVYELEPEMSEKEITLKAVQWRTLTMINGQRTVAEIAQMLGLTDFDAMKVFYTLIKPGLIRERVRSEAAADKPASEPLLLDNEFSRALKSSLTEAMGPIAPFIIAECADELRFDLATPDEESRAMFVESLASRIPDEAIALSFLTTMTAWLRTGV